MEKLIYKVESPVYMSESEIREKYWGRQVLLTNIQSTPRYGKMDGGIVRYYAATATNAKSELMKILAELRENEGEDALDCCGVVYYGDMRYFKYPIGNNT